MTTGRTRVHKDTYLDSVRLLAGSKAMLEVPGVEQATALMGTPANLDQLASDGFDAEALTGAGANDLLLAVRAGSPEAAEAALAPGRAGAARRRRTAAGPRTGRPRPPADRPGPSTRRWPPCPGPTSRSSRCPATTPRSRRTRRCRRGCTSCCSATTCRSRTRSRSRTGRARWAAVMGPGAGTAMLGGVGLGFANVGRPGPGRRRRRRRHRRPGGDEPARPLGRGRRPGASGSAAATCPGRSAGRWPRSAIGRSSATRRPR